MKIHLDFPWGGTFEYERPVRERRLTEEQVTGVLLGIGLIAFLFVMFGLPLLWR